MATPGRRRQGDDPPVQGHDACGRQPPPPALGPAVRRRRPPASAYEPYLAESATPNDDGTVWTITLRDGIVDHAGNPLTADDAIYSLQAVGDFEAGDYGSPFAELHGPEDRASRRSTT